MNKLVITFGRFQPPHWDHVRLFEECNSIASALHANVKIFTSGTQNKSNNPLRFSQKVYYLKKLMPYMSINSDSNLRTIFDVIKNIDLQNFYESVTLVVGADRFKEFDTKVFPQIVKVLENNCTHINNFSIVAAQPFTSIRAHEIRHLVKDNKFSEFFNLYLKNTDLDPNTIENLFLNLRHGMG